MPLVSICIPAYNAEPFIAGTLESAFNQDYPHLEIIVSDDCSTDRTAEIVRNYEARGVRLIPQEKNLGMHANWNAVIRASSGKYVVKLDADDLLEPQYVSSMVTTLEAHPNVAFSHCACRLIDADSNFLGYERSIHGSFIRRGLDEWPRYVFGPMAVNIVTLRRSAYENVGGYDEGFAYSGDWKMHRDLLKIGDVYYNDQVMASYRVHAIGKKGLALIGARENLMHFEDMERHWPLGVPGKNRLLANARRRMAVGLVMAAAQAEPSEARELLRFLSLYGSFLSARLLALLLTMGGSGIINSYCYYKLHLRQVVKKLLYKLPESSIIVGIPSKPQP
jgi:glycosyltransferase involved in cell wall biosynthesis